MEQNTMPLNEGGPSNKPADTGLVILSQVHNPWQHNPVPQQQQQQSQNPEQYLSQQQIQQQIFLQKLQQQHQKQQQLLSQIQSQHGQLQQQLGLQQQQNPEQYLFQQQIQQQIFLQKLQQQHQKQQQLLSQIQSQHGQLQQQLGLQQQQQNPLQPQVQQRLQILGPLLQQPSVFYQQKQLYQSQTHLSETSSSSLDSIALIRQLNGGDWQEEVYQKIQSMKECYLPELNEMYRKFSTKLEQSNSLPQQPNSDHLEKIKVYKMILDRIIAFLQVSKGSISPNTREKLGSYEKQILNFINVNRPRNPLQSEQSNGGDWQEEVYQKIQSMKESYLPELNNMYQKISTKLEQYDSLPQQPNSDHHEKIKIFKMMLDRIIAFLQVSKSNISPDIRERLGSYEKQIINFISVNRPRNPLQFGQLPPPQFTPVQSCENQIKFELQTTNMQDCVAMLQQNMASMNLFDASIAQPSTMNAMQPSTILDSDQEMLLTPCNRFQ